MVDYRLTQDSDTIHKTLRHTDVVMIDGFGTLFDADDLPERAMAAAARTLGIEDVETFGSLWLDFSRKQAWSHRPFQTMRRHFSDSLRQVLQELGREGDIERAVSANIDAIRDVELYADAPRVLAHLRRRWPVVLVSNADNDFVDRVQQRHELQFDVVMTSEAARAYKPAATIFEQAAAVAGSDVHRALMIGDNWQADVEGALHAGACAIWINRLAAAPAPSPHGLLAESSSLAGVAAIVDT